MNPVPTCQAEAQANLQLGLAAGDSTLGPGSRHQFVIPTTVVQCPAGPEHAVTGTRAAPPTSAAVTDVTAGKAAAASGQAGGQILTQKNTPEYY